MPQDATRTRSVELSPASAGALRGMRELLAGFAATVAVWLVHVYGRTLPTAGIGAVWAALTLIMAAGLFWRARIRRAAFLTAYIAPSSPLSHLLRGGVIMASHQGALAAALAAVLTLAVIRLEDGAAWVVLVAAAPALVLTRALVRGVFVRHTNGGYLPELVWRVTAALVGVVMVAALVDVAFHRSYPALHGVSLDQAVFHFIDQEQARSAWVAVLLKMAAAKEALRLWLAEQLMPRPGTSMLQAAGWLILLAEDAVFVWAYLLFCSSVLVASEKISGKPRP